MRVLVSREECKRVRRLHEEGLTRGEIAARLDRSRTTVRQHIRGACRHNGVDRSSPKTEWIVEALVELAEICDPPRVPSQTDWQDWPDRPWTAVTIKSHVDGDWETVLEVAGFPTVAARAPQTIREAVYQRPDLCEVQR